MSKQLSIFIAAIVANMLLLSSANAQIGPAVAIYAEDFEDNNINDGLVGPSPPANFVDPGGNWSVARNGAALTATSDYAAVKAVLPGSGAAGNGFEFRDTDPTSSTDTTTFPRWSSGNIDISALGAGCLHLNLDVYGSGNFEDPTSGDQGADNFFMQVLVDGVEFFLEDLFTGTLVDGTPIWHNDASSDEFNDGNWSSGFFGIPAGTNVQINIFGQNRAGDERFGFDNVTFDWHQQIPEPSRAMLILLGLVTMFMRRSRVSLA